MPMRARSVLIALSLLLAGCASVQEAAFHVGLDAERDRAGFRYRAPSAETGGLALLERPADGPTLLFLHGFAASKDHWVRLAQALPDSLRLVALDLPGHGDSPFDPDERYDVPRLVRGVAAAVAALGLEEVIVVGNSLGGLVATRLALAQPEQVRALVLLNPSGVVAPEPSPFRAALGTGGNPLIPTTTAEYDSLTALAFTEPPDLPWPAGAVLAREAVARAPQNRQIWHDVNTPPDIVTDDLGDLAMPVLLIFGADDRIIDPSSAEVWAAHVPDIETVLVPATGHAPMLERPVYTARLVMDSLRRSAPAGGGR